ncbi:MAG: HAD-IB family phosphatase [Patescibacteria group bacterium]
MASQNKAKRKVAVFDIDGTFFRSSLLIEIVEALIRGKIFPERARRIYRREYENWQDRKGGYDKYITAVVGAFFKNIRGVRRSDFIRVARRTVSEHKNRVYRFTRDLIADLKKKGYYLLAISLSPKYVVEEFAKENGFDKVYGYIYEIDAQGRFTGNTLYSDLIMDKSKILMRAVEKERLTLRGSVGVGDSEADIPFLRIVERPVCFNPNDLLYRAAKRNGWPVVVERKNVIYRL